MGICLSALLLVLVSSFGLSAQEAKDALAPTTTGENAIIRQLHTTTICTNDPDAHLEMFRDALGLEVRGPIDLPAEKKALQRDLWGIPKDIGWSLYVIGRPGVPGTIQVRLIAFDKETPLVRQSWDPKETGGFAMGYPAIELRPWDEGIRAAGFESRMPFSEYSLPRPDGTLYGIQETIFKGTDFIHAVMISRRDGMSQLGPVDPKDGRGGPVYSTQVIEDSEKVLSFYTDVLGLELRSDREFKSAGSEGALGVPDGTTFRFCIVYAPGASSGQLLFMDFRESQTHGTGVSPRPPNRGLVMWSFPVKDVGEHEKRARQASIEVVGGPIEYESPELGRHRALTLLAPNGFLIELFDGGDGKPFGPSE